MSVNMYKRSKVLLENTYHNLEKAKSEGTLDDAFIFRIWKDRNLRMIEDSYP